MSVPTLPGMPDAEDAAEGPEPDTDTPEEDLQDAAKAIVAIVKEGAGYRLTFADGQEFMLKPGDAHVLGPVDTKTTYDHNDGEGPQNLHDLHVAGNIPASLHQMIQLPQEPTAAEAGLMPSPDTSAPAPTLPGMPPPPQQKAA